MKICKKCGNEFGFKAKVNGKVVNLQNRRYCLICSPWGKHNTKKIEKVEDINEKRFCKICNREYIYSRKQGHAKDTCNSCYVNSRRINIKKQLVEYKGGKCEHCGFKSNYLNVYDFHHKDPSEKDLTISGSYCRAYEILKKETDKCIILCANCHRIEHEK